MRSHTIVAGLLLTLLTACGNSSSGTAPQPEVVIQTVIVERTVIVTATPEPTVPSAATQQSLVGHWRNPGTGEEIKFLSNGLTIDPLVISPLMPGGVSRYTLNPDGTQLTQTTIIDIKLENNKMRASFESKISNIEINDDELIIAGVALRRVSSEIVLNQVERYMLDEYLKYEAAPTPTP